MMLNTERDEWQTDTAWHTAYICQGPLSGRRTRLDKNNVMYGLQPSIQSRSLLDITTQVGGTKFGHLGRQHVGGDGNRAYGTQRHHLQGLRIFAGQNKELLHTLGSHRITNMGHSRCITTGFLDTDNTI